MTAIDSPIEQTSAQTRIVRIEVHPKTGEPNAKAANTLADARDLGQALQEVQTAEIFLIEAPLSDQQVNQMASELLADPINQQSVIGAAKLNENAATIEVHYKPGVMDPVAQSTKNAICEMFSAAGMTLDDISVRTGTRYDFLAAADQQSPDPQLLNQLAEQTLANPVIQEIHNQTFLPTQFEHGHAHDQSVTHVPIRELDDKGLSKLSRDGHLFLSLEEMKGIQSYYRSADRMPTDVELETLAQTWSEHCVHKTLKATIKYQQSADDQCSPKPQDWLNRPGHSIDDNGNLIIENLLKSTIAAATTELMAEDLGDWCISVFVDNAGIVKFDDEDAICIKVETHNHPSAIEPYGGAATGIGGCIRDVMGTGLCARPIANTDVFCVAPPDTKDLPKGVIAPKRVLQQIVGGVRDYGNRMGIPTVNGAVYFHEDYLGNPLVYCGCLGILPLDKCFGDAQPGDRIIILGGRTGRDGIHGATFSSAELTDSHADEFSHAVQIGNAITEKTTLDVILQARDYPGGPLYSAITDCGAGGYSSAVGEMGEKVGAYVTLEKAPLKYPGLSYTEIWISEAQERMTLAVPPANVEKLKQMCEAENVEMCDLGYFGVSDDSGDPQLILTYEGEQVGQLSMHLMHEGIPSSTRNAQWSPPTIETTNQPAAVTDDMAKILDSLLAHPNIASKHWIIRQYDHEVQGGSVVKPLVGPGQDGPSDASVVRPKLTSNRGVAIGCGMAPHMGEKAGGDSYWATLAAIDEAIRNLVCVGADPTRIALLDNYCWPSCDDPKQLGSLVRASEACYDGAKAYRAPFVSGKDSLNNQFTTEDGQVITIPATMLITAMGMVNDVNACKTMDAKVAGNLLLILGQTTSALGGSHYIMQTGDSSRDNCIPTFDLAVSTKSATTVAQLIADDNITSAHDCSDGGLLVAAAEMAFAGQIGLDIDLDSVPADRKIDATTAAFAETPARYLLEVTPAQLDAVVKKLRNAKLPFAQIGRFADNNQLTVRSAEQGQIMTANLDNLKTTWRGTLDW